MKLTKLFTPIKFGDIQSKNRIVLAPMICYLATKEGFVSDKNMRHYKERAKGGAGTIVVEGTSVVPYKPLIRRLGIWDDKFIPGLSDLSSCIKKHGAKAFIQLSHRGPKAGVEEEAVSASEIRVGNFMPRRLDERGIYDAIQSFVEAGVRAKDSGFDGVALHAAHFYLLSSFLSPYTNKRDDEFGGDTARRSRIVCEIIEGIKEEAGEGFPVVCRINAVEKMDGAMTIEESKRVSRRLEGAGADAIDVSAYDRPRSPFSVAEALPISGITVKDDPKGTLVQYAAEIKKSVNVPVIAVSKLDDPVFANGVLEEEKADLIAIGRGLLADPYLPKKAHEGKIEEINRCVYCNACWALVLSEKEVRCPINPDLGL